MALIVSLISFALCAFFYVRMIRREIPEPMTKKQSVVPVLLGLAADKLKLKEKLHIGGQF